MVAASPEQQAAVSRNRASLGGALASRSSPAAPATPKFTAERGGDGHDLNCRSGGVHAGMLWHGRYAWVG